jgi:hypothetical protein
MRFSTRNVRSRYRSGSITTAARKLERYNLYLEGVKKVRCNKGSMVRSGDYIFSMEKEINWEKDFCTPQIVSAVKRVQCVSDRISL